MTNFSEYIERLYPAHQVDIDQDRPLSEHTVVGNVVGDVDLAHVQAELRTAFPDVPCALAQVQPTAPSLIPSGGEDRDSVVDLPKRRPLAAAAGGGLVVGIVVGLISGFAISLAAGLILGVFSAAVAGIVAGIAGGGARFAGQRAWDQPNAPTEVITLLAAFTATEPDATSAATIIENSGVGDVKILSGTGAWHLPNT